MQMDFPESAIYFDKYSQLISKADFIIAENTIKFNRNRMQFLETESYEIPLYVDIIDRLLCDLDTLKALKGLMSISLDLLDKLPEKKQELVNTEWLNKLEVILDVINMNMQQRGVIFGDP